MATIYFTSNADSGAGTLRAAIARANDGDTITYDPAVFTSGQIVIPVSSALIAGVSKTLTIDGGKLGVVLDGQGANLAAVSLTNVTVSVINFTIKGFHRNQAAPVYLNSANGVLNLYRCTIVDNENRYFSAVYVNAGIINIYDSLLAGNNVTTNGNFGGGCGAGINGTVNLYRSTVIYNTQKNLYGEARVNQVDSFVGLSPPAISGETPVEIGLVNPPSADVIPLNQWTAGAWENYDFRLKPTSPYLTGASYQSGDKDLLDHDRMGSWGCYDGSWLVVGASGAETVASDAAVDWLEIASTGVLTLSGADRILTVNRGVFVVTGASIASSSRGYVVAPSASDCDAAVLTNVVCCVSGAGASNLSASTTGFSWSAVDSTKSVVLEQQSNGAWQTVAQRAGTSYSVALTAGASVRLFDGVNFFTATVEGGSYDFAELYQAIVVSIPLNSDEKEWTANSHYITTWENVSGTIALDDDGHEWQTITSIISVDDMDGKVKPGQAISILSRIYDAFDNTQPLLNSGTNIDSVYYTCEKYGKGLYVEEFTPMPGHENVSAGASCVLSQLTTDDAWDVDETGYNFILTPDIRTNPLFTSPGTYRFTITINLASGNPIVFYKEVEVTN